LPVVSSNEGASTVFFTPNKRFISERVCSVQYYIIVVRTLRCLRLRKQEEEEQKFSQQQERMIWLSLRRLVGAGHSCFVNDDCVNFLLFFNLPSKRPTRFYLFLGHEKKKKKKEKEKRFWNLHFYNIQSHNTHTQNVYRAIRIYDCGKCSIFRVAIFVLLARFNVRIFVRRGVRAADRFWRENFVFSIISFFSVVEKKKEDRLPIARDKIVNAESASQWFEDAHEREKRA
jgi:hypothetical protein